MGLVICQVFIDFLVLDFFSRVEECTLLAYGCVSICHVSYFNSVRDYLLSGI